MAPRVFRESCTTAVFCLVFQKTALQLGARWESAKSWSCPHPMGLMRKQRRPVSSSARGGMGKWLGKPSCHRTRQWQRCDGFHQSEPKPLTVPVADRVVGLLTAPPAAQSWGQGWGALIVAGDKRHAILPQAGVSFVPSAGRFYKIIILLLLLPFFFFLITLLGSIFLIDKLWAFPLLEVLLAAELILSEREISGWIQLIL